MTEAVSGDPEERNEGVFPGEYRGRMLLSLSAAWAVL
jgi:hypothetical protein